MMFRILCLAVVLGVASAATYQGYLPAKPKEHAHKEGCYIKEIDDVIPFNREIAPVGICVRIECTERMIFYATCGSVGTNDPKCYVTDLDRSRPYPDCCPDVRCEVDNNI